MDADGGLNIHHIVFEAAFDDLVVLVSGIAEAVPGVLAHAVQGEHLYAADVGLVSRQDHPAFAGGDVLGDIEAEAAEVSDGSGLQAVVFGFDSVRAVLDHLEAMPVRDLHDGAHLAGAAGEVHGENGAGPGGDALLDPRRVDVHGRRVDIREHGRRARVENGVHRGAKGQRRGDHLVARADASRNHADVKRGGTGIDGSGLRRCDPLVFRELLFEPSHLGAGAQPPRFEGGRNLVDLCLLDLRRAEDDEWLRHDSVGARVLVRES